MAVRGRIDYDQVRVAARHGTGPVFQMQDGNAVTTGNVAVFDANGNVKDGGVAPGGGGITGEVPAGTLNGTNTVFTLSAAPNPVASLILFVNGIEQRTGVDYTLSGSTITYAVAPVTGDWHYAYYGTTVTTGTPPLIVGFVINNGATGTNVGPMLAAPHAGSFTKCVVTVKASDASTALTFRIRQNGTSVFTTLPSVAAGAASGTVFSFTSLTSTPLPVAVLDVFSIDITGGTSSWQFTAQLE